jgi:hypothetical protein
MIRKLIGYAALVALVGVSACEDALVVDNPNSGNTEKVLGTPADAEALISSYYKRWHVGVYGSQAVEGRLNVWSLMNFSSLANNCQNTSYPFGSSNINNSPGNPCNGEHYSLYRILGEVNRVAASFLRKLDAGDGDSLNLGSPARNNRARAFAEMLRGMSLGYIAIMHDSAAVVSAQMTAADPGALVYYTELLDSAYAAMDRAITLASDPLNTAADGFPIPDTWIPTGGTRPWTGGATGNFVRLIRSYRARIRANVARTPGERRGNAGGSCTAPCAPVDWDAVIADATNGFPDDFLVKTGGTDGFSSLAWRAQYNSFATWHQMPPFYIGMGDNSGSYGAWLAQPLGDRGAGNISFTMVTPDLRFPQGATRTAQQTDFAVSSCQTAATPCKRYFWNRPAADDQFSGLSWGFSNYNHVRWRSWWQAGDAGVARDGKTPVLTIAELNLLRAEGEYYKGNFATAAGLINITRTAGMAGTPSVATGGGLPAIVAFDATSPVPGGVNCVPKVPQAPGFNTVACGNMFEALKWEKRIETAYLSYVPWYLDGRGWGDNPKDTPLFLPVPYQDWQARDKPSSLIYHTGVGIGSAPGSAQASIGTYGW